MTQLRALYLPNFFALEECARLAAALPDADGNALTPVYGAYEGGAPPRTAPYLCRRCGMMRRMMTGRPTAFLCPECDVAKMQRRLARWEAGRSSAWPR